MYIVDHNGEIVLMEYETTTSEDFYKERFNREFNINLSYELNYNFPISSFYLYKNNISRENKNETYKKETSTKETKNKKESI